MTRSIQAPGLPRANGVARPLRVTDPRYEVYVGYCPDLFPAGGVCHGATAPEAFTRLCEIVEDTVKTAEAESVPLPPAQTRPMREVEAMA